jgi:serine/threonine protein kinase
VSTHDPFLVPGQMVGRYRIVRRIAVGGMAELFLSHTRAMHGFEKLVVLKRILPQYAENPQFVDMFLHEARLAATLDHPNIAHVYDIGEFEGSYFFAMEYVHGASLLKVMRAITAARRPLPLEHALNVIVGTCAGLQCAHTKVGLDGTVLGIVHRDISPPNIIISYDGTIKVVDFGIAKAATFHNETAAGTLKGKVPYMSPEQCRAEELDRRSDIFSIGILLYELTVGRRLFLAETEIGIIHKIVAGGYATPTSLHPNYPSHLEAIVMRALNVDRELRYATARDLQVDLEEFAREYKLAVSSAKLAAFMEELFDEEARRWPTSPGLEDDDPMVPPPPESHPGLESQPTLRPGARGARRREPAAPVSMPAQQSNPDLQEFGDAMARILADNPSSKSATSGLGDKPVDPANPLGIDLDNLQVEELIPGKFVDKK